MPFQSFRVALFVARIVYHDRRRLCIGLDCQIINYELNHGRFSPRWQLLGRRVSFASSSLRVYLRSIHYVWQVAMVMKSIRICIFLCIKRQDQTASPIRTFTNRINSLNHSYKRLLAPMDHSVLSGQSLISYIPLEFGFTDLKGNNA
jgi:hypothetical protein